MTERLYLDRTDVYLLADSDAQAGGRVHAVVCEHPSGAEYASRLAASLGIPLRTRPEPEEPPGTGAVPEELPGAGAVPAQAAAPPAPVP